MPILTDKQEPEDFDKPPDDDPNAYALSYLFAQKRPAVELQRTGQVLVLSGAGANIMASLVLWLNQDFGFAWLWLLFSLLVPVLSVLATLLLWRKQPSFGLVLTVIMSLEISSLATGLIELPLWHGLGNAALYYLPGVAVIVGGWLAWRLGFRASA